MAKNEKREQINKRIGLADYYLLSEIDDSPEFNFSRGPITPGDVDYLIEDFKRNGQLSPIIIRRNAEGAAKKYTVVVGFSRTMAARVLRWDEIVARVAEVNEEDSIVLNLAENVVRKDLNMLQEAQAIHLLMERYPDYTEEKIAATFQKSRGWVQTRKLLLDLPPAIRDSVSAGRVTVQQIREIAQMNTFEQQAKAVKRLNEALERNEKVRLVDAPPKDPHEKRARKDPEISAMQDHIMNHFGPSVLTRFAAWCRGYISDVDFFHDLVEYGAERGVDYNVPQNGLL